jgi:hypothetical protein
VNDVRFGALRPQADELTCHYKSCTDFGQKISSGFQPPDQVHRAKRFGLSERGIRYSESKLGHRSQIAQQAVKHKDSEDIMKTNTQQPIAAPWLALYSGQPDQQKAIAFYGTEVLPRLRDRSSRKAA